MVLTKYFHESGESRLKEITRTYPYRIMIGAIAVGFCAGTFNGIISSVCRRQSPQNETIATVFNEEKLWPEYTRAEKAVFAKYNINDENSYTDFAEGRTDVEL